MRLGLVFAVVLVACSGASRGPTAAGKAPIYEEGVDFDARVDAALTESARDGRHVLLMIGGNWCGWCHALHELFERDPKIKARLAESYRLVMIDNRTGASVIDRFAIELPSVPFLTVLDASGKVLVRQETGALEDGPKHDPARVLAFLERWKPTKP
jgi:thiol-disulfide isomerase/thioredoxin